MPVLLMDAVDALRTANLFVKVQMPEEVVNLRIGRRGFYLKRCL